jgi:hypothetical protein
MIHNIDVIQLANNKVIDCWNNLSNIIDISKNLPVYDQVKNHEIIQNDFNYEIKKYLIKPNDETLINIYNDEINKIITEIIQKLSSIYSFDNQDKYQCRDLYLGIYELYKDLKLLDSINDGYLFFDDKKYYQKYAYYTSIIIMSSIFSVNLINNDNNKLSFIEIYKSNPLILFFLCCYVFFDNLIDSPDVDKMTKKLVVTYIDYLFKSGCILDEFNGLEKKYVSTINNIFSILLNYDLNEYPYLYESMYTIFKTEVHTSKYQTFENIDIAKNIDNIIYVSLIKGRETFLASWQIFYITTNFRINYDIMFISNHCGLIFQLLDDLDDINIDIVEKNITLFSYPYLYQFNDEDKITHLKNNVSKLINYVLNIKTELNKINHEFMSAKKKEQYSFALLVYLNYCIAKNSEVRSLFTEYETIFPFKYDDIVKIYHSKTLLMLEYLL